MTEPIETTETVDVDDVAGGANEPPETDAPEADNSNSREARYRVRAREAETALADAQARIETLLRSDIERIAGESLAVAADFWLSSNSVSDYLIDGSLVDVERVREDAKLLVSERPGLRKLQPAYDPSQGSGNVEHKPKPTPTFADLLK